MIAHSCRSSHRDTVDDIGLCIVKLNLRWLLWLQVITQVTRDRLGSHIGLHVITSVIQNYTWMQMMMRDHRGLRVIMTAHTSMITQNHRAQYDDQSIKFYEVFVDGPSGRIVGITFWYLSELHSGHAVCCHAFIQGISKDALVSRLLQSAWHQCSSFLCLHTIASFNLSYCYSTSDHGQAAGYLFCSILIRNKIDDLMYRLRLFPGYFKGTVQSQQ